MWGKRHLAKDCTAPEALRFRCGWPGHRQADCPQQNSSGASRARVIWGGDEPGPYFGQMLAGQVCEPPHDHDDDADIALMIHDAPTPWRSRAVIEELSSSPASPAVAAYIGDEKWDKQNLAIGQTVAYWKLCTVTIVGIDDNKYLIDDGTGLVEPIFSQDVYGSGGDGRQAQDDAAAAAATAAAGDDWWAGQHDPWTRATRKGHDARPQRSDTSGAAAWNSYKPTHAIQEQWETMPESTITTLAVRANTAAPSRRVIDNINKMLVPAPTAVMEPIRKTNIFDDNVPEVQTKQQKNTKLAGLLGVAMAATAIPPSGSSHGRYRRGGGGNSDDDGDDEGWRPKYASPLSKGSSSTFYPCYQWEEEDETELALTNDNMEETNHEDCKKARISKAYGHSMTRIEGKEAILPDTGAVHSITGGRFVRCQGRLAKKHGKKVTWIKLDKPKHVAGVGGRTESCHYQAIAPGRLHDGGNLEFAAPVIPSDGQGGETSIPALVGLEDMARMKCFIGTRLCTMHMVPDGQEKAIQWPPGTRCVQMDKPLRAIGLSRSATSIRIPSRTTAAASRAASDKQGLPAARVRCSRRRYALNTAILPSRIRHGRLEAHRRTICPPKPRSPRCNWRPC